MTASFAEDLCRHVDAMRALARDLLGDETLADDAVQQACVKALQRPPSPPLAPLAWLGSVVRNCAIDLRRSERRRQRREQAAARAEIRDDADAGEQLELQEHLVVAMRSLDEIYRTAVWLRYFEGRSPSQIAQRLGVPAKTIKTRLWRALQQLRQRLEGRYGDREALFGVLLPLALRPVPVPLPGAALAAGALLMQGKNMIVAAGLLALLAVTAVELWPEGPSAPTHSSATATPVASSTQYPSEDDAALPAEPVHRDAAAPPAVAAPTEPYGGLVVQVRWHDDTAAAGVAVTLLARQEPQLDRDELRLVADATGVVHAPHLHAGAVTLTSDRGGKVETEVEAGSAHEVLFDLPRGLDVSGTVVDERQLPVAAANVVLVSPRGGWLGGCTMARTGSDGAFSMRSVDATWSLGALASGYAPGELVDLEAIERATDQTAVQVVLRLLKPGGSVAGTVVDEQGAGIADATVVLGRGGGGHREAGEAGRTRESWCPQTTSTAADGSFRFDGVAPGSQPIAARADGRARAVAEVHCVAGESTAITMTLGLGVTVHGTVCNESGATVADCVILALDQPANDVAIDFALGVDLAELGRAETRSDAEGRFLLRAAPAGELHLVAAKRHGMSQFEGVCQTSLSARPGDEISWDPVLVAGKTLRVRVVDADGKGVFLGLPLSAIAEQPAGAASTLFALSERHPIGLHVFTDCADVPYTIAARLTRMGKKTHYVFLHGVRPGDAEVELRLPAEPEPAPPARVSGRIADLGHRLGGNPPKVSLCTNATMKPLQVDDGRFTVDDVPPGRYFVWVQAGDDMVLKSPWFDVLPAQPLDLGDLATEPGATLRIAVRAPAGVDLGIQEAHLDEGFYVRKLLWDGSYLVADNVTAGRHRLTLTTDGWHAPPRDLELIAGRDNLFPIDVVPATKRRIELVMPFPDQWQRCEVALRDAQGELVSELHLTAEAVGMNTWPWRANQPFGIFTLEAMLDAVPHSWPVDLREQTGSDRVLRFSLR